MNDWQRVHRSVCGRLASAFKRNICISFPLCARDRSKRRKKRTCRRSCTSYETSTCLRRNYCGFFVARGEFIAPPFQANYIFARKVNRDVVTKVVHHFLCEKHYYMKMRVKIVIFYNCFYD